GGAGILRAEDATHVARASAAPRLAGEDVRVDEPRGFLCDRQRDLAQRLVRQPARQPRPTLAAVGALEDAAARARLPHLGTGRSQALPRRGVENVRIVRIERD